MEYYMAPMEGVTTEVFRRIYHAYFLPFDKYFTPFLVPHLKKGFNSSELREIDPATQKGMYVVPQILTNNSQDFLRTVKKLEEFGYREVNLNLGCPSKTVVSKYRGSGFLAKPRELNRFLDEIYRGTDVKISIKTRIGKLSSEEFSEILEIYKQYPIEELIIHPRVQQDFYKNHPDLDAFSYAVSHCDLPICYNGDLFSKEDVENFREKFPRIEKIMIGRGIVGNPFLLEEISKKTSDGTPGETVGEPALRDKIDPSLLVEFLNALQEEYQKICSGQRPVLYKMKEVWYYLGKQFPGCEKELKKIKKAEKMEAYQAAVREILFG